MNSLTQVKLNLAMLPKWKLILISTFVTVLVVTASFQTFLSLCQLLSYNLGIETFIQFFKKQRRKTCCRNKFVFPKIDTVNPCSVWCYIRSLLSSISDKITEKGGKNSGCWNKKVLERKIFQVLVQLAKGKDFHFYYKTIVWNKRVREKKIL